MPRNLGPSANTLGWGTGSTIIRGSITAAGGITSGSGFTVVKNAGLGSYTVTFSTSFGVPIIVNTQELSTGDGAERSSRLTTVSATGANFTINWYNNGSAALIDSAFHFLALAA